MKAFPSMRDLVTDVSWNYKVKQGIKKFTPRPPDNPDGTWTSIRATPLKLGNRTITIGEGITFTRGEPFMFIDVAEYLDEQSK